MIAAVRSPLIVAPSGNRQDYSPDHGTEPASSMLDRLAKFTSSCCGLERVSFMSSDSDGVGNSP